MALQVWLPLTKDLRNQGLSNVTVTNNGATFNSAGKLGGCYSFSGSSQKIVNTLPSTITSSVGSLSCWIKMNSLPGSSSFYNLLQLGNLGGYATCRLGLYMEYTNYINISIDGSGTSSNRYTHSMVANQWYHICVTYDGTIVKLYIDGSEVLSKTASKGSYTTAASNLYIGGTSSYYLNGYMNDARYYNHCLSPMEVKELSKGLVLHYPLNRGGWGQENLLPVNGSTIINSTQSFEFQGWVQNFYTKTWMNEHLTPGKQYTLSYTVTCLSIPDSTYTFKENRHSPILVHQGNGWNQVTITSDGIKSTNMAVGQSRDYKCTFIFATASENYEYYGLCGYTALYRNSSNNAQYAKFRIDNLKLEEGSIKTPWCPNSSDNLADEMGLNSIIEYDTSGYCNNGEKIGTLTYTSDTPKYQVSTHIGAASQKIHISGLTTSGFGNSYSFAWWGKRTSNSPMFWGFSDGIRLNGMYIGTLWNTGDGSNNPLYEIGTTTQVTAPSVNVWHHYVMTGNGTKCYVYLDGELWAEAKTYKAISGTSIYINGWNSATDYCSNNTDISDFRIYATALSAADVKSLYQNCVTIDPDGTIRGKIR